MEGEMKRQLINELGICYLSNDEYKKGLIIDYLSQDMVIGCSLTELMIGNPLLPFEVKNV